MPPAEAPQHCAQHRRHACQRYSAASLVCQTRHYAAVAGRAQCPARTLSVNSRPRAQPPPSCSMPTTTASPWSRPNGTTTAPFSRRSPTAQGQGPALATHPATINRKWRLQARSASDDKAPILAYPRRAGCPESHRPRARHQSQKFYPRWRRRSRFPAPGRRSSPKYKPLLAGDGWIFCDGPIHQSRRQHIAFGARGNYNVEVTIFGPRNELHSRPLWQLGAEPGSGNGAHCSPPMKECRWPCAHRRFLLMTWCRSMTPKNAPIARPARCGPGTARANSPGLYRIGPGAAFDESINLPALNIQGFSSGGVGNEARQRDPFNTATASIGMRPGERAMSPRKDPTAVGGTRAPPGLLRRQPRAHRCRALDPTRASPCSSPKKWHRRPFARRLTEPISQRVITPVRKRARQPVLLYFHGGPLPSMPLKT